MSLSNLSVLVSAHKSLVLIFSLCPAKVNRPQAVSTDACIPHQSEAQTLKSRSICSRCHLLASLHRAKIPEGLDSLRKGGHSVSVW